MFFSSPAANLQHSQTMHGWHEDVGCWQLLMWLQLWSHKQSKRSVSSPKSVPMMRRRLQAKFWQLILSKILNIIAGLPMAKNWMTQGWKNTQEGPHPALEIATFLDPRFKALVSFLDKCSRAAIQAKVMELTKAPCPCENDVPVPMEEKQKKRLVVIVLVMEEEVDAAEARNHVDIACEHDLKCCLMQCAWKCLMQPTRFSMIFWMVERSQGSPLSPIQTFSTKVICSIWKGLHRQADLNPEMVEKLLHVSENLTVAEVWVGFWQSWCWMPKSRCEIIELVLIIRSEQFGQMRIVVWQFTQWGFLHKPVTNYINSL